MDDLAQALSKEATFILRVDHHQIALSWWVSAKRTRTYPYARVYDSLAFSGKKVTIIPIVKDEGADGERDFLQYDTVSLMSLLGVYVIIGYYKYAEVNPRYPNKITKQRYDTQQIVDEIQKILSYQSDALHWNLEQLGNAGEIGEKAIESYSSISKTLGVRLHSIKLARKRIRSWKKAGRHFLNYQGIWLRKHREEKALLNNLKKNLRVKKLE
jgi:hypothetical protein